MIAYLCGTVLSKQEKSIVVAVNGTGYLVSVPRGLKEKVAVTDTVNLHIHTQVREDDISLYGFESEDEWQFFRLLLTVSGVGPKSALEILNAPLPKIRGAIVKKDVAMLTQVPGIGNKTAQRIIVDLQGKVHEDMLQEQVGGRSEHEDIVQALISLGYQRQHVIAGLKKIPQEISGDEAIIKYFLQNI